MSAHAVICTDRPVHVNGYLYVDIPKIRSWEERHELETSNLPVTDSNAIPP